MHALIRTTLAALSTLLLASTCVVGQTAADRVSIGGEVNLHLPAGSIGGGPGFGADLFVRWNVMPQFSLIGRMGGGNVCFFPSADDYALYPDYYGPSDTLFYPNTTGEVEREDANSTSMTLWSISGTYNIFPEEQIVPYVSFGLGLAAFTPKNSDQGSELPNALAGDVFSSPTMMIPFGVGVEWYITTELVASADLRHTITTTNFLDDLDDGGLPDQFTTLGLGLSYYVVGELDCDKDGLSDREEKRLGTDPCLADTDGDRLGDIDEIRVHGTDPLKGDTDGDKLGDAEELAEGLRTNPLRADTDGDGLDDGREHLELKTDPLSADSDGDGLEDGAEVERYQTDPLKRDSDADMLEDGQEVEIGTDPLKVDTDTDELGDGEEVITFKTDPLKPDSDDDNLADGEEVNTLGTDPNNPDTDGDRLTDGSEVRTVLTDPNDPDTDDDTVGDGEDACPLVRGVPERNGCPSAPKVGTITDFPAVYFKVDSDAFDFSQEGTTESLAMIMSYVNQCPNLRVLIEGHASREGSDRRNSQLSEMRADRVRLWLVERGIPAEKIAGTIGYGSVRNAVEEPAPDSEEARNMDPEELEAIRRQNRRIAVRVVKTCEE